MNFDVELYEGKTYNDLLKDIVTNADNKRDQIEIVIAELRDQIKTINDAIVLAPIIKEYLDVSVKNDDALVKLAAVVQRLISATSESDESNMGLSDQEKEQLLRDIKNVQSEVKSPIEVKKIEKKH
jgi:hypothetical protein